MRPWLYNVKLCAFKRGKRWIIKGKHLCSKSEAASTRCSHGKSSHAGQALGGWHGSGPAGRGRFLVSPLWWVGVQQSARQLACK